MDRRYHAHVLGGLGFGFKWDMGWMHDTLKYFSHDPVHRSFHHNDLTFSMMYAWSENFILPLSHDEVVYGKGSLLRKMPGDDWQKFANLRLLLGYMYTHYGQKLLMAGAELGTWNEWHHESHLKRSFPVPSARRHFEVSCRSGRLYREDSAMWRWDAKHEGFTWIDCTDHFNSVLAYIRRGPDGFLVCVCNFTPVVRKAYAVGVPEPGAYQEILISDSEFFGGSMWETAVLSIPNRTRKHGYDQSLNLILPPLGCLVFRKI